METILEFWNALLSGLKKYIYMYNPFYAILKRSFFFFQNFVEKRDSATWQGLIVERGKRPLGFANPWTVYWKWAIPKLQPVLPHESIKRNLDNRAIIARYSRLSNLRETDHEGASGFFERVVRNCRRECNKINNVQFILSLGFSILVIGRIYEFRFAKEGRPRIREEGAQLFPFLYGFARWNT